MQYNAGAHSIVEDVHYWAGTDSTTYPIADITRNANSAVDRIISLILKHDNSWEWSDANSATLDIGTKDLVSGQEDYSVAIGQLKLLKVRVKDPNGNWITLTPRSRRKLSDADLIATGVPRTYDMLGNSLMLSPIPNYSSSAGIEAQFQLSGDHFLVTDTTEEPGFAPQFHRLVSLYAALDYTDPNDLEARSQKIRMRIGRPPEGGVPGIGLEGELCTFYADRDYDQAQNISVQQEDYGSSMLY